MKAPTHALTRARLSHLARRASGSIDRFLFTPARATPLATLRIGLAAVLLLQAAMVGPVLFELYGRSGILQGALREAVARNGLPRISWVIDALAPLGVGETPIIAGTAGLYLASLLALLVGYRTRAAAVGAWLSHLMLMMSANSTNYGADQYANIFLYYLMWMPAGAALSLDRRSGRASGEPRPFARLSLRVIQLHLCISYLASGIDKARGSQWWNGDAMWRTLMLPEYRQLDFSFLSHHPWMAMIAGWTVLVVEIGYAFFVWPRKTRRLWVAVTVALHFGIIFFMGLTIFGAIMIVLTVSAFAVSAEPRHLPAVPVPVPAPEPATIT